MHRDYSSVELNIPSDAGRYMRMRTVCDALWNAFGTRGYSWCGFYLFDPAQQSMILAARQPKPACSPIGLEGMCGLCWRELRPVLIHDVRQVADGAYIACDPRDLSEVVVPLIQNNTCWGVLDVDSFEVGAFSQADVDGLLQVAVSAGLSDPVSAQTLRY